MLEIALGNLDVGEKIGEIQESLADVKKLIDSRTSQENEDLIYRRQTLEFVVNYVEVGFKGLTDVVLLFFLFQVLSLCTLVCLLCCELVKPTPQGKKGRKKMAATAENSSNNSNNKEILGPLAETLNRHIEELCKTVQSWSSFSVSGDLTQMLEALNLNDDKQNVFDNIVNSYVYSCKELECVLKSKTKMLKL